MNWIDKLSGAGSALTVKAGETLYSEGSPGGTLYVVFEGRVGLYTTAGHAKIKVADVTQGGFFGAEGFFDESALLCTAKAETSALVLLLPRASALPLMQETPEALVQVVMSLTGVLRGIKGKPGQIKMAQAAPPPAPAQPAQSVPPPAPVVHKPEPAPAAPPPPAPKPVPTGPTGPLDLSALKGDAPSLSILPPGHPRYDVTAPESHNTYVTYKSHTCPCCHKPFHDAHILNSRLKTKEVKDDMRVIHDGFEVLWYSVRVCQNCNAAALSHVFNKFTSRDTKLMHLSGYVDKVPRFGGYNKPRAIQEVLEAYYLALLCVKHIDNDPMNCAQLWRRLMWLYDDLGDTAMQQVALENTIEYYEETYTKKRLTPSESFHLSVILGDLCARKGDRGAAYKHFYEAVHGDDKTNQVLLRHAQDMITELRRGN